MLHHRLTRASLAILPLLLSTPSWAQESPPEERSPSEEGQTQPAETTAPSASQAAPTHSEAPKSEQPVTEQVESTKSLFLVLTLKDSALSQEEVLTALTTEFGFAPQILPAGDGLQLEIHGRQLMASYRTLGSTTVQREIELPKNHEAQLDTVALMAGNLARDEAGDLIDELRAKEAEEQKKRDAEQAARDEEEARKKEAAAATLAAEKAKAASASEEKESELKKAEPKAKQDQDKEPEKEPSPSERPPIKKTHVSASFTGSLSLPPGLADMETRLELGAVHSRIGSLDGFAINLLTLKNRGIDSDGAGRGVQLAGVWLGRDGAFEGVSAALISVTESGGTNGVQLSAISAFQKEWLKGVQAAGIISLTGGGGEGAQLAGLVTGMRGDFEGAQAATLLSVTHGNFDGIQAGILGVATTERFDGIQLSVLGAFAGERAKGFQMGLGTFTRELRGAQLGVMNASLHQMRGIQIGGVNLAGDFEGTQLGLLNLGGRGKGNMFGLVNIAQELDGTAIAPVNIIPGSRNQIVTYVSYAPIVEKEGLPGGPMTHMALKFMPGPVYSQVSFGLGPEARECTTDDATGDETCRGGGVEYAPGFAIGLRQKLIAGLFIEADAQYQFEKAFSPSLNMQHGVLGRAALGYEFFESISIFAGGGPRLNIRSGPDVNPDPEFSFSPHFHGGLQFF